MATQSKEFIKISVVYKNLLSWVRIKRDFVFTDHNQIHNNEQGLVPCTLVLVYNTFSNPIFILFLIHVIESKCM